VSSEGPSGSYARSKRVFVVYGHDDLDVMPSLNSRYVGHELATVAAWAKTQRFLHGKTHGDLQPANILVPRSGWSPRLIDLSFLEPTVELILEGGRSVTVSAKRPPWDLGLEAEVVGRRLTDLEKKLHDESYVEGLFYSSSTDVYGQDRREVKSARLWRLTNKMLGKNLFRLIQRRMAIYLRRRSNETEQAPTAVRRIDGIGLDHSAESHRSRAPSRVRKTPFLVFRELVPI
jgi:hypothetical protein